MAIKITNGSTTIRNARGSMTTQPRSFADVLSGKSTTSYTRPSKPINQSSKASNGWKPLGPISNGKGVGP